MHKLLTVRDINAFAHTQYIFNPYLGSNSLYVFSGDAFKCGVFLFVVNEGLHVLFEMKLLFGQVVYTAQENGGKRK